MATVTRPATAEQHFVMHGMDWDFYGQLLARLDQRRAFVTYDRGTIELMSPSKEHEQGAAILGRLLELVTLEREIPILSGGSTTFRRQDLDRGLEPDRCYWIGNEARVRKRRRIDLRRDPPPDLAIEVEISRRLLDRVGIYAALGVPELWRFDGARLRILILGRDRRYRPVERSRALPMLRAADVERFLKLAGTMDETSLLRSFREWLGRGSDRRHLPR